jgi:hypothetical protein
VAVQWTAELLGEGSRPIRLALCPQRQATLLSRLRVIPGWGVNLQPAAWRPRHGPVRAVQARLRLKAKHSAIELRQCGGIIGRQDN